MTVSVRDRGGREAGISIVEIVMSLVIFSVLLLAGGLTLLRGVEQRSTSMERYRVYNALRDVIAEIQDVANQPQNLAAGVGIGAVWSQYDGRTITVPDLPNGQILVECFGNETIVPAELGGPQDLNFDGDPDDDLENASAGTDLKLVPTRLTLTYADGLPGEIVVVHRLFTKTAN